MVAEPIGGVADSGNDVTLLLEEAKKAVRLVAKAPSELYKAHFWDIHRHLCRLEGPTAHLESLKDQAGGIVVRLWLEELSKALVAIEAYAKKRPKKRATSWCLALPIFVCVPTIVFDQTPYWCCNAVSSLQRLDKKYETVNLSSSLERLTDQVRGIAAGSREGAGAQNAAQTSTVANQAAISERIAELQTVLAQTIGTVRAD